MLQQWHPCPKSSLISFFSLFTCLETGKVDVLWDRSPCDEHWEHMPRWGLPPQNTWGKPSWREEKEPAMSNGTHEWVPHSPLQPCPCLQDRDVTTTQRRAGQANMGTSWRNAEEAKGKMGMKGRAFPPRRWNNLGRNKTIVGAMNFKTKPTELLFTALKLPKTEDPHSWPPHRALGAPEAAPEVPACATSSS